MIDSIIFRTKEELLNQYDLRRKLLQKILKEENPFKLNVMKYEYDAMSARIDHHNDDMTYLRKRLGNVSDEYVYEMMDKICPEDMQKMMRSLIIMKRKNLIVNHGG